MSKQRCAGKPGEPRRIPREVPVGPNFRYDWDDCPGCPDCKPEPCVDCGGEGFVLKETSNFAHASGCDGHKCATDCPVEVRDTEPIGCERCQHTGRKPEPSEATIALAGKVLSCTGLGYGSEIYRHGHTESILVNAARLIDTALDEVYRRGLDEGYNQHTERAEKAEAERDKAIELLQERCVCEDERRGYGCDYELAVKRFLGENNE